MRQTTIICDKCGAIVTDQQPGVLTISGMGALVQAEKIDLCADCSRLFLDWLRSRELAALKQGQTVDL
jgi:hypothetical protein